MTFKGPLKIGIDVSGRPDNNIFIGLSSIGIFQSTKIEKEFKEKLSEYYKNKKKASELNEHDLLKIIQFLSENKVHMGSITISPQDWIQHRKFYRGKQWFEEKVFGIYYSHLLKQFTYPRYMHEHKYDIVCCQESYLDINKVLDVCRRLAGMIDRDYSMSFSSAKHELLIRFADFVSGAVRKVPQEKLNKIECFRVIKTSPSISFFHKVFEK